MMNKMYKIATTLQWEGKNDRKKFLRSFENIHSVPLSLTFAVRNAFLFFSLSEQCLLVITYLGCKWYLEVSSKLLPKICVSANSSQLTFLLEHSCKIAPTIDHRTERKMSLSKKLIFWSLHFGKDAKLRHWLSQIQLSTKSLFYFVPYMR